MSQNHISSDGIPGRDQIDNPTLNTMGQYHGSNPWFSHLERNLPYMTCQVLLRVHTRRPFTKLTYAL